MSETKIYLASSWKNQKVILKLAEQLELEGFEVDAFCRDGKRYVFHWSELVDNETDLQNYDAINFLSDPRTKRAFNEDKKWLDWANMVVMVMPCGRSSHMEAGYAVGSGKRLFILGEFQKGEFDVMYGFAQALYRWEDYPKLVNDIRLQSPEITGMRI